MMVKFKKRDGTKICVAGSRHLAIFSKYLFFESRFALSEWRDG